MNELSLFNKEEKVITTKQLAEDLGVDVKTIQRASEKLFDKNVVKTISTGGRPTQVFDEAQATAIKIELQNHSKVARNELSLFNEERLMTTRELAEQLKTSSKVILENARKCLPEKLIENGKTTYWNQAEITVLIEQMKTSNPNQNTFTEAVKAVSTELTPALKIRNAMLMMQEAYEEELKNINAKYLAEKAVTDRVATFAVCYTMNQTAKALKLPYGNIKLYEKLRKEGVLNLDNSPKQEQVSSGHFKVVVKHINDKVGSKPVTLVTGKGIVYLAKKLNAEIDESVQADA